MAENHVDNTGTERGKGKMLNMCIADKTNNPEFREHFRVLKSKYTKNLKNNKKKAYDTFLSISKNKIKDSWKLVNREHNSIKPPKNVHRA